MTTLASRLNAIDVNPAHLRGIDYQQIPAASLAAVQTLTVPGKAQEALIQCNGGIVRWRVDGKADPTGAVGAVLADGDSFIVRGQHAMTAFKCIASMGVPILDVTYMG